MSDQTPAHITSLKLMKNKAVAVAADAKDLADQLRVHYAKTLLTEAFPDHTLAIFTRSWDDDEPDLLQLLSDRDDVADIDFGLVPETPLSAHQQSALADAEHVIVSVGSDNDILKHLDPGMEDHTDWVEFQLPLTDN